MQYNEVVAVIPGSLSIQKPTKGIVSFPFADHPARTPSTSHNPASGPQRAHVRHAI